MPPLNNVPTSQQAKDDSNNHLAEPAAAAPVELMAAGNGDSKKQKSWLDMIEVANDQKSFMMLSRVSEKEDKSKI